MDWVKVYTVVIITLALAVGIIKDGEKKESTNDWYDGLISAFVMLPFMVASSDIGNLDNGTGTQY